MNGGVSRIGMFDDGTLTKQFCFRKIFSERFFMVFVDVN